MEEQLNLSGARVLILDADGVLCRLPDGRELEGLPHLEDVLRSPEFSDVLIVAAGNWKNVLSLESIRGIFSEDLQHRVVDTTPTIASSDQFRSHVEIFAWLGEHPEIASDLVLESASFGGCEPYLENAVFVPPDEVLDKEANYLKTRLRRLAATDGSPQ